MVSKRRAGLTRPSVLLVGCAILCIGTAPARAVVTQGEPSASAALTQAREGFLAQASSKETKRKKEKKKPPFSFSGNVDLHFIYDDNILRMSDGMIDDFRHGIDPQKFEIETYDDLIMSPRFGATLGRRLIGKRETSLRFLYIRWQYVRNGVKNNDSYTLRFRQPTVGQDFFEASYSYAPGSYIKQLSDREPFAPRSSTPLVWLPFESTRNAFILGYSRRVSSRLTARLDGGRVMRFYNQPFLENDNWEWNATGSLSFAISPTVRFSGSYTYVDAEARALDTVGETVATSDDSDGSYERDLYEGELRWRPGSRFEQIASFGLMGQYQEYYFTSTKPYYDDPLHTGRNDRVYVLEFTLDTKPVYGPMRLLAGYRYSQRKSSLPATVQAEDAEEKDYKDDRFWVGASYPFSGLPW